MKKNLLIISLFISYAATIYTNQQKNTSSNNFTKSHWGPFGKAKTEGTNFTNDRPLSEQFKETYDREKGCLTNIRESVVPEGAKPGREQGVKEHLKLVDIQQKKPYYDAGHMYNIYKKLREDIGV